MNIRLKKFHYEDTLLLLIIFIATLPTGLSVYMNSSIYDFISSYASIFSFLAMLIIVFTHKVNILNYKITIFVTIFRLYLVLNAMFRTNNEAAVSENIRYFFLIVSVCACCEYFISRNKLHVFLRVACNLYIFYLIINSVLMFIYPDGLTQARLYTLNGLAFRNVSYHFIGFRNYFGFYFVPVLGFIYITKLYDKKRYVLLQILIIANTLLAQSSTSIIAICVFYMMIFLNYFSKYYVDRNKFKLTNTLVFISYFVLVLILVIFSSGDGIREFVASIFHKEASLTGRTTVWRYAITAILENPLMGYGNDDVILMNSNYWYAHNGVLDLLIQGGLISLLMFVVICGYSYRALAEHKNTEFYRISVPITTAICAIMLVESIINYSILSYALLVIFGNSKKIIDNIQKIKIV